VPADRVDALSVSRQVQENIHVFVLVGDNRLLHAAADVHRHAADFFRLDLFITLLALESLVQRCNVLLVVNLSVRVVLLVSQDLAVGVIFYLWQDAVETGQASVFRVKGAVSFFYLLLVISLLGVYTNHSVIFFLI